MGKIHASLEHEILQQLANLVVHDGGDNGGTQSEAAAQTPNHVVLATAFVHLEGTGCPDATIARVKSQHDLA